MTGWSQEMMDNRLDDLRALIEGMKCSTCGGNMIPKTLWNIDENVAKVHCGECDMVYRYTIEELDAMFGGNPFADERSI